MSHIELTYTRYCEISSDINEHLPTLYKYARECRHVTECGVRSAISSYAFANALRGRDNRLIMVDLHGCDRIQKCLNECKNENVNASFYEESDLTCPMEDTDLLFIDTWHVYGHLKKELARWNAHVGKYIILHDTTVDGEVGESVRAGWNIEQQSKDSGLTTEEIRKGLWPAVEEFLVEHPEWMLKERFTNNNGLTVLARRS
jgi:hypothetical protein